MNDVEAECSRASSLYALEPMRVEDLPEVLAIEHAAFSNPWSREAFLHEIENNPCSRAIVARTTMPTSRRIAGYCVRWVVFEQMHIQNIAVHPQHQRRGLARCLIEDAIKGGKKAGARKAVLEVRESNRAAQRLYLSLGFREVGRRRGYYSRPREDAILYAKDSLDAGA